MIGDSAEFRVDGEPIPQGSKKGFVVKGRAVLVDDNKVKLKPWRAMIKKAANLGYTFTGPVIVSATFYMTRPQSVTRKYPSVKPDLDKLMRALGDGMTDGKLIKDDALIVDENIKKRYADGVKPGVVVTVTDIGEEA